jgi:mRNA interferase RelE/StbE
LAWTIEWSANAGKQLKKLDRAIQSSIVDYIDGRIAPSSNPKHFGKPLHARLKGLWRYRVGDYRIICRIEDDRLVVLVVAIGHRKDVYE